jgi:hypothetical protein
VLSSGNNGAFTALFVGNFGDSFLHLHETHGRYRVRSPDPNIVGVLQRECSPDFFCSGEIVAGAGELLGKYTAGPNSDRTVACVQLTESASWEYDRNLRGRRGKADLR